ncbi:hypothetical protein [Neorhizobium sp. JUb45]|uniref:hypothetical protein n=1 Tax=Neorhizobium sp. JUb45 TaxID=2485113 RepID=UPI00104D5BB0|nr:hypothetical protein [Neorhizobium sp. JUb45]TCR04071.1 hypothetical protein EDF70_102167 [Neorhizobium sp. JUb45]
MNQNKILVDEQSVIDLCAHATVHRHVLAFLTANLFRVGVPHAEWGEMLDKLQQSMTSFGSIDPAASERDAVIASDIGIKTFEHGAALVDVVRGYLAKG